MNFVQVVRFEFWRCVTFHGEVLASWFVVSIASCDFESEKL